MTAPRKPVAWISGVWLEAISRNPAISRAAQRVIISVERAGRRNIPLYTAPDLPPLWALVEKWEALETDFAAYAFCARELRQKLEAMQ